MVDFISIKTNNHEKVNRKFTAMALGGILAGAVMAVYALGPFTALGEATRDEGVGTSPRAAAFLKIDGIDGESKDDKHKGEIVIESWSWGMSQSGAGAPAGRGGAGAGKVSTSDIVVNKELDKSSPQLMKALADGKHIKEVVLSLRKAGENQEDYLIITMKNVMVTSYSVSGSSANDRPMESLSLNFEEIKVEYKEMKEDGTAGNTETFEYDSKTNTSK
jgi:type VI secretion system secreted protein Hcp